MDGEPQPRAGEKNGARKSEPARKPARELLIFEFPAFADERSDPICLRTFAPKSSHAQIFLKL